MLRLDVGASRLGDCRVGDEQGTIRTERARVGLVGAVHDPPDATGPVVRGAAMPLLAGDAADR